VQCKTGWEIGGCIAFNRRSTDHGRGRQPYLGRADLFAVYFPADGTIYLVPVAEASASTGA
jgi:PD-(D/E)XK endonuclease